MNQAQRLLNNLQPANFEGDIGGRRIGLFELTNNTGMRVFITNYGARLVSVQVPDKDKRPTDVVAGFDSLEGYLQAPELYYGAIIGRYSNRIANGLFPLGGKTHEVTVNNGTNTLHGGKKGFHSVVWDIARADTTELEARYFSGNMEEGFPGNLLVKVTYMLTDDNCLKISFEAKADKYTIINLSNHAFFNLNGEGSGTILNHQVQIKADNYTPVGNNLIPTGEIDTVANTPFDFRSAATIGSRINDHNVQLKSGGGYDHNFVLNKHAWRTPVARVKGDISGIIMEIFTDQPGLQFYTGNFMQGKNTLKCGQKDDYRTAFALDTQRFPDAPNQPSFPSAELKPGQLYKTTTCYKFSS